MRSLVVAAALLITFTPLRAQTIDPALEKARQARNEATRASDAETWRRYTTDDFLIVGPEGQVATKTQRMAAYKAGTVTASPPPKTLKHELRVYGEHRDRHVAS